MARNKNKTIKSTTEQDDTLDVNGEDAEDDATPEKPTQEQARTLLAAYTETDNNVTKIEEQLDAAKKARSEAVKAIHDALGKGPFSYKGAYLGKIVARDGNYFFRGRGDSELVSFD